MMAYLLPKSFHALSTFLRKALVFWQFVGQNQSMYNCFHLFKTPAKVLRQKLSDETLN